MEQKNNIAEILKDCPKGMGLDCTMYEDVCFDYVDKLNIIHCYIQHEAHKTSITFNQHGTPNSDIKSKCVIFPKGKKTWEDFQRPFKDGDIISDFDAICIFKDEGIIKGTVDYYCGICCSDELFIKDVKDKAEHFGDIDKYNLATEEEKARLFDAIKANGYKWNSETKTLEKLVEPKFKVGDIITKRDSIENSWVVSSVSSEYYGLQLPKGSEGIGTLPIIDQDKYELIPNKFDITSSKKATQHKFKVGDRIKHRWGEIVYRIVQITEGSYVLDNLCSIPISVEYMYNLIPNKFDITTLKPFESKVLVRDTNTDKWRGAFYSHYKSKKFYIIGGSYYYQCIPYEGNEYLLDTTNDCDNYYKNW